MTIRQVFEAVLIECNKIQAPTLKLYEFNYLIKKAINQYVNKKYNIYGLNQQTTDDLRVLQSSSSIRAGELKNSNYQSGFYYEVNFPSDYLHLLNLRCIYEITSTKNCQEKGSYIEIPAKRLTSDSWGQIITDTYNKPSYKNPYYYIHNINKELTEPTNLYENGSGTDQIIVSKDIDYQFPRTFNILENTSVSSIEKPIGVRNSNVTPVRCEIRCGKNPRFKLTEIKIDYIKSPQNLKLTQNQLDLTNDTSQIMEFPDYVNQEIINELVHLIMERSSNPRLNTNMQITQSIARPTEQQQ